MADRFRQTGQERVLCAGIASMKPTKNFALLGPPRWAAPAPQQWHMLCSLHRYIFRKGAIMSLDLLKEKGVPLEQQTFNWKQLVRLQTSKLDDDAFTRVRIVLMNGIEAEALRFKHACARMNKDLQLAL